MTVVHLGDGRYKGLAGDTKPTTVPDHTEFVETDTRKKYYFDSANTAWIPQELQTYQKFRVTKVGTTTYVINLHSKRVASSATESAAAIQAMLDQMTNGTVWEFVFDATTFTLDNPILLPFITSVGNQRKVIFTGTGWFGQSNPTANSTKLIPSASFPNQRYLIECQNQAPQTRTSQFYIDGIIFHNALPGNTKDVGAMLLEGADILNGNMSWSIKNCTFVYMWRGLHGRGMFWYGMIENIIVMSSFTGWLGDAPFKFEVGGHTGIHNPSPKGLQIKNIHASIGEGIYNAFFDIKSLGYSLVDNVWIDGKYYSSAVISLDNSDYPAGHIAANTFRHIYTLDLEVPAPDVRNSNLWLNGTVGKVYDNVFQDCRLGNYPSSVKLEGTGAFRNEIEIVARWTSTPSTVVDTGSGESNTIIVRPGVKQDAGEVAITHTGGVSRIIDHRRGAEKAGATSVADGGTISHGLFTTPLWVQATASVANEHVSVTAKSSTTFTVAVKTNAGAAGTTQTVYWRAGVYS